MTVKNTMKQMQESNLLKYDHVQGCFQQVLFGMTTESWR